MQKLRNELLYLPSIQKDAFLDRVGFVRNSAIILISCVNEANWFATCTDKARKSFHTVGLRGEVVVVNYGSTNGSI